MVRKVKCAVLRECWLHIWFRFNVTGRSYGLRSPRGFSWPLIIKATAHRCAPLFEIGNLGAKKSDTDIGALIFRTNPRAPFLRACVFWPIFDAAPFFLISANLSLQGGARHATHDLH